ncbi:MAG: hypothetical protein HUU52_06630 [Armatimonadetes bacterium]|nr:hypothetical protein [Armatimonadota bacterium]
MIGHELRPKVFISCGQHTEDERGIARQIADELSKFGFEPYVAVIEQTVEGLKNNLFRQLETSEYFLFIDFKREQIANSADHRGSLFTNQELAIASFLGLEAIGFQEVGVKQYDGMIGVMQLNAEPFRDRSGLVEQVLKRVHAQWRSRWKRALTFEVGLNPYNEFYSDATFHEDDGENQFRFHFLAVRNLHDRVSANDCQVYVTKLNLVDSALDLLRAGTELKWSGYMYPAVRIRPGTARLFDALVVPHASTKNAFLHSITDATDYFSRLCSEGTFEIEFEVTSSNFPTARCQALISIGASVEDSTILLESV